MGTPIKAGDTVFLKGSSQPMVVSELGEFSKEKISNGAKCHWFDGPVAVEKVFPLIVLEHEDDSDPGIAFGFIK